VLLKFAEKQDYEALTNLREQMKADPFLSTISNPETTGCLQAVDYFLWALQRFYEPQVHSATGEVTRQDRFLNALWDQMAEIHGAHFGPAQGTFSTKVNPLALESRFPTFKPRRKKP
jgi:hypothetical protein